METTSQQHFQGFPSPNEMELDADESIVTPGQTITQDVSFMRGHGTYPIDEDTLVSSLAGKIERVNQLISVKAFRTRYTGEIGDVVVGRITELCAKKWKVDINARQDAILLLSSVNLPGGVQRRKSESDELQMRSFFAEGDLLSAEIQSFFQDGSVSLHTRNFKYGKLRNGSLVIVPSFLVKRSKSHFLSLSFGVDVILGLNGYVWVCKHVPVTQEIIDDPEKLYSNENEEIMKEEREKIARVCICIDALSKRSIVIDETLIVYAYEASQDYTLKEMLQLETLSQIVIQAQNELASHK